MLFIGNKTKHKVTYDCVGVGKFIFLAASAHSSLGLGVSTVGII